MENFIRTTLCSILINHNDSSRFGDFQFKLTSLPIRFGGLGISNPIDLSHFVYIASVDYTWNLQNNILNFSFEPIHPKEYLELKSQFVFTFLHNNPDALPPHPTFSNLATLVYTFNSNQLFNQHPFLSTKPIDIQRRFKAILSSFQKSQSANHYLFALPNYGLNQVMTKLEFHTHMALRLLLPIFPPNQKCSRPTCNLRMDSHGYHALCCPGRSMFARHELLAWALYYAVVFIQLVVSVPLGIQPVEPIPELLHFVQQIFSSLHHGTTNQLVLMSPSYLPYMLLSLQPILSLVKLLISQNQIKLLNIYHLVNLPALTSFRLVWTVSVILVKKPYPLSINFAAPLSKQKVSHNI
jgi:hypothetical protein